MPFDPRMDAYIAKAKPFARPILEHIRAAVRAGCPDVEETIKWGMPSFYHKGPLCGMAAFKEHATFGFWKHSLLSRRLPKAQEYAFPPSHKRDYVEWIVEAKRDETRAKRVAQAVEWIAQGKSRNWKYE